MTESSNGNFEKIRNGAQYFTMTAAILYGLLWVITGLIKGESLENNTLANVLLIATMVGGVAMGILYVVHLARK